MAGLRLLNVSGLGAGGGTSIGWLYSGCLVWPLVGLSMGFVIGAGVGGLEKGWLLIGSCCLPLVVSGRWLQALGVFSLTKRDVSTGV